MQRLPQNKMATRPIGPLLITMGLPIMLSMMIQALYNVVDSIFIAQISEEALTAVLASTLNNYVSLDIIKMS